jgi:hypothetical protein
MPIDFGIYNALNASPNLQQRRQDAAFRASVIEQQRRQIEEDQQKRLAAIQGISQYFGAVDAATSQLLPQDVERLKYAENELRRGIINDIKRFGNDPNRFLLMGGQMKLQQYINKYQQLPQYQQALKNKENLALAMKAITDPELRPRSVSWTRTDGTNMRGTIMDNLDDFSKGYTDQVSYDGAYKSPKINDLDFAKVKRGFQQVSTPEFIQHVMLTNGMNASDASDWLSSYGSGFLDPSDPNKTIFRYGGTDPVDDEYKRMRNELLRNRLDAEDKRMLNMWDSYARFGGDARQGSYIGYSAVSDEQPWTVYGSDGSTSQIPVRIETYDISPERGRRYLSGLGLYPVKNNETKELEWQQSFNAPRRVYLSDGTPVVINPDDIRRVSDVDYNLMFVARDVSGGRPGQGQQLMRGTFELTSDAAERLGLSQYRVHKYGGERSGYGFLGLHGGVEVPLYIPVESTFPEQYVFNKYYGQKLGVSQDYMEQDMLNESYPYSGADQDAADVIQYGQ